MHAPQPVSRRISILCTSVLLALAGCGGGGGGGGEGAQSSAAASVTEVVAAVAAPAASASVDASGPPAEDSQPGIKLISSVEPAAADAALADNNRLVVAAAAPEAAIAAVQTHSVAAGAQTAAGASTSLDFYVASGGNDGWSGTLSAPNALRTDGPLRTLTAAQTRVRANLLAMQAGSTRLPINVRIAAGEYRLSAPLAFGAGDSGTVAAPVVYRAETAGTVTLSGALRVASTAAVAAPTLLNLATPALDASTIRGGSQLYVNGRRATLARSPNAGSYWFVNKALPMAEEPATGKGQEAFAPPPEALALINGLSASDKSQAIVQVMQEWTSGWHRVSASAAPAGGVRVSPRAKWPFLQGGLNQRFFVENVAAALDAPGEWLWDSAGLRYITAPADNNQPLAFDMPQLDKLIVITGNAATNVFVHDLEFRGLNFAYTRRVTPDEGYVDNQAAYTIGAAIEVDAARRIVIDACTITRTGGYGVWLRAAVRESQVSNCRMSDLGAGGIKVGQAALWPTGANGTGLNTISANSIIDTGKLLPGAVAIWVGQSSDNTVANNLVANTSYSGISVGWKWGYGATTASGNRITNNLLVNIGMAQLSDMAAIYTLGESPGTVISGNVIHEVRSYPGYGAGSWGLYNDSGSSNVLWERNVVVGTDDGGYLLNQGRNNTVRSNVLAFGNRHEVRLAIQNAGTNLAFDSNVLIPKVLTPFDSLATAPDFVYTGNRVSNRVLAGTLDLTRCGSGCTLSTAMLTVGADPRVITLAGVDAATAAWVASVGANAGPPGLATSAIPAVNANLPAAIVAPPIGFEAEIADTAIGAKPFSLTYRTGNNPAAIAIQAAVGTPSGKCLKFTDSATMPNAWDPHAWATLNHKSGISTAEFSINIDAGTDFMHEWRDSNQPPYLTGPALRIKPSGIEVAGVKVAAAPVGQWISLKITAPLDAGAGRWTLDAKVGSGAYARIGDYANRDASWKRFNWMGFVSAAKVASSYCVGFIKADTTGN